MNVLFSITSSSKCRVWQHSSGQENTARQSNSTCYTKEQLRSIHWSVLVTDYTGDGLPNLQPSTRSACTPGVLRESPGTNRLPNSLHPATWLVTQAALLENLCAASLCLDCLYMHHWESPAESTLRNGRFSTGERGSAQQPLSPSHVKQHIQ